MSCGDDHRFQNSEVPARLPAQTGAAYAAWQLTPDRQRHEWKRARRSIIAMRLRLLIYGHAAFFIACLYLKAHGSIYSANFTHAAWYSLFLTSAFLLGFEWFHVKYPPRQPARFVIRPTGVTEYGDEGPRAHWEWHRIRQLRLEADRERPEFRSLVFVHGPRLPRWIENLGSVAVPLPGDSTPSFKFEGDEWQALIAVAAALGDNGIGWKANDRDGVALNCIPIEKSRYEKMWQAAA
jgi:hypothetical protein